MKRVCLLTGAGGRLGTSFCQLYRGRYDIAAVYRRRPPEVPSQSQRLQDPLAPTAALPENEDPVFTLQADLTEEGGLRRVVEVTLARFGRIDLVVNAAAGPGYLGALLDCEHYAARMGAHFELGAQVPLRLAALVARTCWRDRPDGAANRNVVNVSSASTLKVNTESGLGVHSAARAALNYLSCHLAHEFRPFGVRVNTLAPADFPGAVATAAVARGIVRLDEGDMTGKVLVVDADGERFTG